MREVRPPYAPTARPRTGLALVPPSSRERHGAGTGVCDRLRPDSPPPQRSCSGIALQWDEPRSAPGAVQKILGPLGRAPDGAQSGRQA